MFQTTNQAVTITYLVLDALLLKHAAGDMLGRRGGCPHFILFVRVGWVRWYGVGCNNVLLHLHSEIMLR